MAKCHSFYEGGEQTFIFNAAAEDDSPDSVAVNNKAVDNKELSKEDKVKHITEIRTCKYAEILALHDLGCFRRMLRSQSRNMVDTRWVITWKIKDGKLVIKCRITMRGFKDRCTDLETYAGTASRAGQRMVNSVCAQHEDFVLFSFDVSAAFAKGMTFEELSRLTGMPLRKVEFTLAADDVALLRKIKGYEDFDPLKEVLAMIKPIYGLKDAPRAWRKKLHQVLVSWSMGQLRAEGELYAKHRYTLTQGDEKSSERLDTMVKREAASAIEDDAAVTAIAKSRTRRSCPILVMLLSTHVDDLKGCATRVDAEDLLRHLCKAFGPCKADWQKFTHTGIEHERVPRGVTCHQNKYIDQIKPIKNEVLTGIDDVDLVPAFVHELYRKLLGEVAWVMMTRADLAVYVQALQRRCAAPRAMDIRRLNLVLRYLRRHRITIWYGTVPPPYRLVGFSDAAFRAQDEESSGLALRGLAVVLTTDSDVAPTSPTESVNLLDYLVRRIRRVVRSTFSAELNALLDAIESLMLLQLAWHEVLHGTRESIDSLMAAMEAGSLEPPIELVGDARSVFDSIKTPDVCDPAEASLKLHLISVRSRLESGLIRKLWWADTRDMLADALTKGGVDRAIIMRCMDQGKLKIAYDTLQCVRTGRQL